MAGFPQENQWDCGKEAITCKCSALRESQDGRTNKSDKTTKKIDKNRIRI